MNKQKTKKKELKHRIFNAIMISGNKTTAEKVFLKSVKITQKLNNKSAVELIKQSVLRSTPTFKINKQTLKKGKRKSKKEIPEFIKKEYQRIVLSLKFIMLATKKQSLLTFPKKFAAEMLSNNAKSKSTEYKNELQKQVLLKKRYIHKFRW